MLEHRIGLGGDRTMAVAEFGATSSDRVFVTNHGTGSSRLEAVLYEQVLGELGWHVIALERPGYGDSTPLGDGRVLAHWGDDAAKVVDHLGIETFAVSGYSGGGPHALAIAASDALAGRVERVVLIASIAPGQPERSEHGREIQARAGAMPWSEFESWFESDIMGELANVVPADEEVFADPDFSAAAMATVTEGLKQGSIGDASDQWALFTPWGFDVGAVTQPVDIWHGEPDRVVPVEHARVLAAALPSAELHLLPDEGHFSIARYLPDLLGSAVPRENA